MEIATRNRIIKACDAPLEGTHEDAATILKDSLSSFPRFTGIAKIGLANVSQIDEQLIKALKSVGFECFIDLKFFDIPNTVGLAVYRMTKLGVKIINVHAMGSKRMMIAALHGREAALMENPKLERPLLIAVTVLTSISQEEFNEEIGIPGLIIDTVMRYSINTAEVGFDGVVCSGLETPILRDSSDIPKDFVIINPGIRPTGSAKDDQRRITTATQAFNNRADYIVCGRPIKTVHGAELLFNEVDKAINN